MLKILDCESVTSTYKSIEQILRIDESRLQRLFESIDIDTSCGEECLRAVMKATGGEPRYDRTCWFHLTRTTPGNKFEQGLLPLGESIDLIWELLRSLAIPNVSKACWDAFRRDLEGASCEPHHYALLYEMKTTDKDHWGPFGMLIRDHAFEPIDLGNYDYLDVPEIVRDICICFSERSRFNLLQAFIDKTQPCIVKFFQDSAERNDLAAALYYLYNQFRGLGLGMSWACDAEGRVNPEQILSVDFLRSK